MSADRAVPPQRVEAFKVVANATHASTVTVRCDADLERQYREGVADAGMMVRFPVRLHRDNAPATAPAADAKKETR